MPENLATVFDVHHWIIPTTTCDYPVLAVAQDRSALLSLGNYGLGFDWGIPEEAATWLEQDFAPTGQTLQCDLSILDHLLKTLFAGGAEFGMVRFDDRLCPAELTLALAAQEQAEQNAEYLILAPGSYQRFHREPDRLVAVSAGERAMLDVCVATFAELAAQHAALLRQPVPPRYRGAGRMTPLLSN